MGTQTWNQIAKRPEYKYFACVSERERILERERERERVLFCSWQEALVFGVL